MWYYLVNMSSQIQVLVQPYSHIFNFIRKPYTLIFEYCSYNNNSSVLSGFNFKNWLFIHNVISFIQLGTSLFRTLYWTDNKKVFIPFVSSANDDVLNRHLLKTFGCDLTCIENSLGPRTDPWGAPYITFWVFVFYPHLLCSTS